MPSQRDDSDEVSQHMVYVVTPHLNRLFEMVQMRQCWKWPVVRWPYVPTCRQGPPRNLQILDFSGPNLSFWQ